MANDAEDVDKNFNKFVESMYQYVKEPIKDFASIKPQLLNIFKTHRPVRIVDYEYGISKSLKGKSQLIIHEFNQRSMVREYFKTGKNDWHCCECTRTASSESNNDDEIPDVLVLHGIIFVKLKHDCGGREFSFVQKVQKLYKEKKVEEADALQKSVLGSEDLNVASSKQKSAAIKNKGYSAKLRQEIISEIRLQYTQPTNNSVEELLTTDKSFDKNQEKLTPEEAFSKIIENLEEYTNETKEVVMANKSKLLLCLKTHYPVQLGNYQYGLMMNLRDNRRLFVFEWGDGRRVREYSRYTARRPNLWRCLTCEVRIVHELQPSSSLLYLVSGVAFVPYKHECQPRDYQLVLIFQKFLEQGNTVKARAMARTISFSYGQSLANIINSLSVSSAKSKPFTDHEYEVIENENNSENVTNLKRKMLSDSENDSIFRDEKLSIHKKSKLNKSNLNDTVTDVEMDERPSTLITKTSIYHFEKPSTSKLEEICDKLNIEYRTKVVKLWDKIIFDQIDTVSMPSSNMKTHYFETDNIYQILSIFFTGKSKQHEQIKTTIIDAFREKLVSSGELSIKTFNRRYLDTVTDEHFDFISEFLKCRILIFDGEIGIKKFGKWKSPSSIRLTLVVAFKDGYYSIVLRL